MDAVHKFTTFTNIDLVVRIPVEFEPDAPFSSLAGATVDARALAPSGAIIVGTAAVLPDNVTIIVTFPRGALPIGLCRCQVWAQVGQQAAMPFVFDADVQRGLRPV